MTNVSVLDELLRVALFTPAEYISGTSSTETLWGIPLGLCSVPGIGKSSRIYQAARKYGLTSRTLVLSQCAPEDIGGLPVMSGDRVKRLPIGPIADLAEARRGILLLDEFSTAAPALMAPALRIVHERTAGDTFMGNGTRVLMAYNPPEQSAGGWSIPLPMVNRMVIIKLEPKLDEYSTYLLNGPPSDEERVNIDENEVLAAFAPRYRQASAMIDAFLKRRPDWLCKPPADNEAAESWPSYRSWDLTARVIAGCQVHRVSEECKRQMIVGTVGEGVAHEFLAFLSTVAVLPDPEDILRYETKTSAKGSEIVFVGAAKADLYPKRPDLQIACISSITAAALMTHKDQENRMLACFSYLDRVFDGGMADHAVPSAKELLTKNGAIMKKAAAAKFLGKILPLLPNPRS